MAKTTPRHFKVFNLEFLKLAVRYNLKSWKVYFRHKKLNDVYATCYRDLNARNATISLNIEWDDAVRPLSDVEVKLVAKHEALHLLLGRLVCIASSRYVTDSELDEAEHEVIQTLMHLI